MLDMRLGEVMDDEFSKLGDDELFLLARRANQEVFKRALPIVRRIAAKYCHEYTWLNVEDLAHAMMQEVPRIAFTYREHNQWGNGWGKYLYHRLYYVAKDCLRKEDPLGIGWPQKKQYPQWHRLGDESLAGFEAIDEAKELDSIPVDTFREDLDYLKRLCRLNLHGCAGVRRMFGDKPKRLTARHWDKGRSRVRFRIRKDIRFATWVQAYVIQRDKPEQFELSFE